VLTHEGIAADITEMALALTESKYVMLLLINAIFLIAGCVMDNTSALYILVPILMPITQTMGIDMIHLGVIIILNLSIGQVTPPVGPNLYVAANIGCVSFESICMKMMPLLLMSIIALLLVTFVPWLSLALVK
jgi:C4-dicarboxylate transporter DctM subunit